MCFKVFNRHPLYLVKTNHINVLANHCGGSVLIGQTYHPWATHHLLRYNNTKFSFTDKGKYKDENSEVRLESSWIGPKLSFEAKDALFSKYKIVNRVHNLWKTYHVNKDKKKWTSSLEETSS